MPALTTPENGAPTDGPPHRLDEFWEFLPEEASQGSEGMLTIGGVGVDELARRYGTPLHVFDEAGLRRQARRFVDRLRELWPNSEVLFATKSMPAVAMCRLAHEEGLSIDVAGGGELALALAAGVDPQKIYFHGNAKTDAEIRQGIDSGVGVFIIDNEDEVERLEAHLTGPQRVLLRVQPGVDAPTHESMATGGSQSKFGVPIDAAPRLIERIERNPHMRFEGVHVHIGSQILTTEPFGEAIRSVSSFGDLAVYNVGGGLGIKYSYADEAPSVEEYLRAIVSAAEQFLPRSARLLIEPGRSVVARAGVTLYTVTSVKRTGKNFVAVDGGLADQLDVALTGQRYEALLANRLNEPWSETAQVVGRQCESGDLLVDRAPLPPAKAGDLLVMAATGAYSYTLSNNYNGALKPAVVMVSDGRSRLVVRRETFDDLLNTHLVSIHGRAD